MCHRSTKLANLTIFEIINKFKINANFAIFLNTSTPGMAHFLEKRHLLGARSEGNCDDPDQHFAMPGLPDAEGMRILAMIATVDSL